MSVPKSKRKESRFEAQHNLYILRKEVTNLVVADFGFSEEKYLEQMERYRAAHRSAENVDEVCARWQEKCEGFKVWYADGHRARYQADQSEKCNTRAQEAKGVQAPARRGAHHLRGRRAVRKIVDGHVRQADEQGAD